LSTEDLIVDPGSFRDPSGYIFYKNGEVYRAVMDSYRLHYDRFIEGGLYQTLQSQGLLVSHEETSAENTTGVYKVIKPKQIPFISYPYEWCFEQLRDAAILTMKIQQIALQHGMILKDATAYNVQFLGWQPIFIDSLSFEVYEEGKPWVAYRQFCQHFLAPLLLMKYRDWRLSALLKSFVDGIPLDLASRLLPRKTYAKFSILSHIHLQAKAISKYSQQVMKKDKAVSVSRNSMVALNDHLSSTISSISLPGERSQWGEYYDETNYSNEGLVHKESILKELLTLTRGDFAVDLGANDGRFSRILAAHGYYTVAADLDHEAVRKNYRQSAQEKDARILSLVIDLTNPSPSLGWANRERSEFASRTKANVVLAFALIHHLCFSHNIPLEAISKYFSSLGKWLIIEFVPIDDSQVAYLPKPNAAITAAYSIENFEKVFGQHFQLLRREFVKDSGRCIFLYQLK
jgi:hypothetical protein